ncbi:MAG: NADH-quinone oxidoreductase subunit J [Gammaproteobacteria bacterium]|jgi:NADH-quinone oxidoreductase subunit J|nr:NADH-quinone oxidoreductase subunit J [Gammaproteobacteria bacterium]
MSFTEVVFFVFASIMVLSALRMITVRNPVLAALFLVLTFFSGAAIWLLAEAEFLAIVLVLVYVGAVMVLFLFVVMMLDINIARMREGFIKYLPVGVFVAIVLLVEMVLVVGAKTFDDSSAPVPAPEGFDNTQALGSVLYTEYVYPFEIAAVILLVAIVAAIALTLRKRPETRYQNPARQVRVKREDRVRLVKMEGERS